MFEAATGKKTLNGRHKFYRINYQIPALQLRLLDEEGKQIGIVSKIEALQKAKELSLDVVEISASAKPPVAKLIDFKKFKYQEAKKERENKKSQKNVGVKEIRLRPFMGAHDLDTRKRQTQQFVDEGNQIKVSVFFKGRELGRKQFGYDILKRFVESLESVKIVRDPHMEGKSLVTMLAKDKAKATDLLKENESKNQKDSSKAV